MRLTRITGNQLASFFFLAPFALLCGSLARGADPIAAPVESAADSVVAEVNGEAILAEDFRKYFRAYLGQKYYHGVALEQRPAIADEAMKELINDRLLLQEVRRRGLKGDPKKAETRMQALRARYSRSPAAAAEFKSNSAGIEAEVLNSTKVEELNAIVKDAGVLSEDVVRAFYDENPELFTTPQSMDVSIIVVGVPPHGMSEDWKAAETKAGELHARLLAGDSFETIAAENSTDVSASNGGRLGPVHEGQIPQNVTAVLDETAIGALTEPIRILEGIAIFKLHERKPASLQAFESVAERAEGLLRRQMEDEKWKSFLTDLRANARIEQKQSPADVVRDI